MALAILVVGFTTAEHTAFGADTPSLPAQAAGQVARQRYTSPNGNIDYEGFLRNAMAVSRTRSFSTRAATPSLVSFT